MTRLLTAKRPMRYATRRLKAGDTFEAKDRDARILTGIGRADYVEGNREPASIPAMPAALKTRVMRAARDPDGNAPEDAAPADAAAVDDLPALRTEYEAATGKRPYWGWDADALRAKIAEAGAAS